MKAKDLIRWAMTFADEGTRTLVAPMRERPLTQPTSSGGNHPLWVMGHLAYLEGCLPQVLFGEPNPVEHWEPLFAPGSTPQTDPAAYPSFDEVHRAYHDLRKQNLQRLSDLSETELDQPPRQIPPGFEEAMKSVGQTYVLMALHQMVHYGQITDARRVAGIPPLQ